MIIEHTHYRIGPGEDAAFLAAVAAARELLRDARGYRRLELARAGATGADGIVRVDWRAAADADAFAASEPGRERTRVLAFAIVDHRIETPIDLPAAPVAHEAAALRKAFAHYPTGVAVVTAAGPLALVVSSFTSVSLDPVLVAFCAARLSETWPKIADAGRCCINVLAESQEELSRQLASRGERRFEAVAYRASPGGAPILEGVIAWFDCRIAEIRPAGDHDLVLLEMLDHGTAAEVEPLIFHRSAYLGLRPPPR